MANEEQRQWMDGEFGCQPVANIFFDFLDLPGEIHNCNFFSFYDLFCSSDEVS
jgi:hypothetical protein